MPLPSRLPFTAFLKYAPRGSSPLSRMSKRYVQAIKSNTTEHTLGGLVRIIPYCATRLKAELPLHACLSSCFSAGVIAVPAPRRAPLVAGGLWPAMKLCEAFRAEGLVSDVRTLLERKLAVTKSATAKPSQRPSPEVHYESIAVSAVPPLLTARSRLLVVDDVITRGATSLACYARLLESYPGVPIHCFALVRTISPGEIDRLIDPVTGEITFGPGNLHREP